MVCKEEVLLWFKDLDSYTRIDVLYELLNMCLPFELRFIGSCVEELGKHTYQELRGPAITANDVDKLSKDSLLGHGILEETVRHRLLIYLSLLSSRNYHVSNWLYRKLLRTDHIEEYLVKDKGKDDMLHSEFLLLYTMALHHPAFTFEQKQFFSRVLSNLIDFKENRISAKHSSLGYPPGFGYPTQKCQCGQQQQQQQQPTGSASPAGPKQSPPSSMTCSAASGDSTIHPASMAYHHQQPPGLPQLPPMPPHLDFVPVPPPPTATAPVPATVWSARPGFPYGAPPEVPPFPSAATASAISPLVTGGAPLPAISPTDSRSSSPHRTPANQQPQPAVSSSVMVPPPVGVPPPPPAPPSLESVAQLSLEQPPPQFSNDVGQIATVEEVEQAVKMNSLEEKHLRELIWPHHLHHPHHHPPMPSGDTKPNGVRFPAYIGGGKVRPYLMEQMRALHLDGENSSLHQSNSSVGSCSSPEDTPPSTPKGGHPTVVLPPRPSAIIATGQPTTATPHGPGRGEKARTNGLPYGNGQQQQQPSQQQSVTPAPPGVQQPAQQAPAVVQQDTSSPPPPQQPPPPPPPATAFGNSSVPYAFQQFTQLPPNRSMFHYNHQQAQQQQQQHRPPTAAFTVAQFPPYPENFPPPTYTFPYVPLMYSSPFPTRPPGCYNCGSPNHQGSECAVQHIDEITQKKAYQLEYAAPPPAAQQAPPPAALAGQEAEK